MRATRAETPENGTPGHGQMGESSGEVVPRRLGEPSNSMASETSSQLRRSDRNRVYASPEIAEPSKEPEIPALKVENITEPDNSPGSHDQDQEMADVDDSILMIPEYRPDTQASNTPAPIGQQQTQAPCRDLANLGTLVDSTWPGLTSFLGLKQLSKELCQLSDQIEIASRSLPDDARTALLANFTQMNFNVQIEHVKRLISENEIRGDDADSGRIKLIELLGGIPKPDGN
ncbi:hypothetical protein EDC01DRAFT_636149 [Geopyxis carbonaria]|nr:hypothetical protein EDC01DRAFT_636149 [Geopyxis carbonaria]